MATITVIHTPRPRASCEVHIAPGSLASITPMLRDLAGDRAMALVTDENVAPLWGDRLRAQLAALLSGALVYSVLPAGEQYKTRAQKEALEDVWLAAGLGRDTLVVALGGGVITDLVGFTAGTYLRGVPYVSLPTTLIGQVDAAVGGKTAVDTPAGKNLIGVFHQPLAVFMDPGVLATLPEREYRGGLAEVVKHGVIRDAELFELIEANVSGLLARDSVLLENVVTRNVALKASVVGEDERESGLRQILNFGHTIAHAVERLREYRENHGDCVAMGMVVEAHVAALLDVCPAGLAPRLRALLARLGLPTVVPTDLGEAAIIAATAADKKKRAGKVRYALPAELGRMHPGDGRWSLPVDDAMVARALRASRAEPSTRAELQSGEPE